MPTAVFFVGTPEVCETELSEYTSAISYLPGWDCAVFRLYECCTDEIRVPQNLSDVRLVTLIAHGSKERFGCRELVSSWSWTEFAAAVCSFCNNESEVQFFLSCCRGGDDSVLSSMFSHCPFVDAICGPLSDASSANLSTAFRSFVLCLAGGSDACQSIGITHSNSGLPFSCITRPKVTSAISAECSVCMSLENAKFTVGPSVGVYPFEGTYKVVENYENGDKYVDFLNGCQGCIDSSGQLISSYCSGFSVVS
jgi:hypothetical protein